MSIQITAKNIKRIVEDYSELEGTARTEKGALSFCCSGDPRLDLFFKSVRSIPCRNPDKSQSSEKYLEFLLGESWKVSPLDTLKIIFYIRDCRGGKGEKRIFTACIRWLIEHHLQVAKDCIKYIPHYGKWKDLLIIFAGTPLEEAAIYFHTDQLRKDLEIVKEEDEKPHISLAAKYAPSEKSKFDKKYNMVAKYCAALGVNKVQYRKHILGPLRALNNIVEQLMTAKRWEDVDYSQVPSIASKIYRKAFTRHDKERYIEYLQNVMKGTQKINVSTLMPYQIIEPYIKGHELDQTLEAFWQTFIAKQKKSERCNMIPIIDTSGSMTETSCRVMPLTVAVSLGLALSLTNSEDSPFYKKWITFSVSPKLETIHGETLHEIYNNIDKINWDMNTDFAKVFDLILDQAVFFSVSPENMPSVLVVLSDMQFDEADNGKTNWDYIEKKYNLAGYERPTIIFWNLRGNTVDFPVTKDVPRTALIGGFNMEILNSVIDGKIPNPLDVMRKVIDSERYSIITL